MSLGTRKNKKKTNIFLLSIYAPANQPDNSLNPNGAPKMVEQQRAAAIVITGKRKKSVIKKAGRI